jgi:putative transposase
MIDRTHALPVARQCQLLQLARSTAYYQPRPVSETTLALMRRIDERHLQYPFAGARMLRDLLRQEGHAIGRRQVATPMRRMGITAVYRMPRTSQRHPAHRIYPYLLRQLTITRPNHVWASDITYVPMKRGFVYLCAILDWASRRVLAWRLSNTLTTDFCGRGAGGPHPLWPPRDLQHGSRLSVHQPGIHRASADAWNSDQHGWSRAMAGQCLCRAVVAESQI